MTSFRATFGLTRSIGGWEEGERRERNKRKRQPGRTGAGQRGEWQLNEQREEINIDVEEREGYLDVFVVVVVVVLLGNPTGLSWPNNGFQDISATLA